MRFTTRGSLERYRQKRNFARTAEPEGSSSSETQPLSLRFVIQKHAASHLHFDWRLEMDGVMKSWAVPKGPSLDPSARRLAMQVEDHPIEYNTFEGTIPKGEYGGGTVMLWDVGEYEPLEGDLESLRRDYRKGRLKIRMHGGRLRGEFALVRTSSSDDDKPKWLLIKHADEHATTEVDIVEQEQTSIATGRTMEEIAADDGQVWHAPPERARASARRRTVQSSASSSVAAAPSPRRESAMARRRASAIEPMLASPALGIPTGNGWTFEPKYDGIRAIAYVAGRDVALMSRNANDKSAQFPDVTIALGQLGTKVQRPLVIDGEIVAIEGDEPARFQDLQGRMHSTSDRKISSTASSKPAAYVAFDLLLDGDDTLVLEPWHVRRARLETLIRTTRIPGIRIAQSLEGGGDTLLALARQRGWEGIIAKRVDAPYEPGKRSKCWLKLKAELQQELVVGGWTEPRNSREHIGALLLGFYDETKRFIYAGHTGAGFTREGLKAMYDRLAPLETDESPFVRPPKTNSKPHWTEPRVVVEIRFNEWTQDGKLRQPVFLGVRDDKNPRDVRREPGPVSTRATGALEPTAERKLSLVKGAASPAPPKRATKKASRDAWTGGAGAVLRQLETLQRARSGVLDLGGGVKLEVTNLDKVFFPKTGTTKGDLMRYYAEVAPFILPAVADRPLVLKRFPNGVGSEAFYQQRAPEQYPGGVRVEEVGANDRDFEPRFIAGNLATLLYLVQLGAISVDPWHSRVGSIDCPDYTIVDLDPGDKATFEDVIEVALRVKQVIDKLGIRAVPKTSGASGLHVVIPLEPDTSDETARLLAQAVATDVASSMPKLATIERAVRARSPSSIYVDFLQNIRGKTVASVYSVRAQPQPSVSTPLTWDEVKPGLDPRDFTIDTVPARLRAVGDLWAAAMRRPNSLARLAARG